MVFTFGYWLIGFQFIFLCTVAGFFFATGQRWSVKVWNKFDDWYYEQFIYPNLHREYCSTLEEVSEETPQIEVTLEPDHE